MLAYPQWTTEITDNTVVGEDQLGVEGAAQSYQQSILPGITTVTEHARYYSFYAWVLYRFIFHGDLTKRVKNFRGPFFKRHEVALILSAFPHHDQDNPFSGVVGSGTHNVKVKKFWDSGDPISLDQTYFQNSEGGFGQYYRTSMQIMEILDVPKDARLVYPLKERGKKLAEAYEASIKDTQYFRNLESISPLTHISQIDAVEYGHVGCMCPEAINLGQDRSLLLDTFFRFDLPQKPDNPNVRRRNSLGVVLDLVDKADGHFLRTMLRPALYIGEYTPGHRYSPADEIKDWVKRWRMVEVRHLFTFGIQNLWAAFLLELYSNTNLTKEDWTTWTQNRLIKLDWNLPVSHLAKKVCSEAGIVGEFEDLLHSVRKDFGLQSGLDEYSLYLQATRNRTNSHVLFQTGVRVLLQLYLRYFSEYSKQDPIWQEMANRERLPLNDYFKSFKKHADQEDWSTFDWIRWLYQDYIFEQHEMIALEKLRYQEYDTFKFYYEDNTFRWAVDKKPYREPIRLAGNRLDNCLTMLIDLGLIVENPDHTLLLTSDGKKHYEDVLRGLKHGN